MKHVLLSGFGVGLSWGVMDVHIDSRKCLPIEYTNDVYTKGTLENA